MKFVHLSFIVASGGPTFASAATYACPAPGAPSTIISNVVTPTTISIPIISSPNGLCILLRQNASDGTKRAPVARSYAARGEWEKSPGLFSKTGSGVSVNCPGAEDDETCDITVPPLREGEVYALESYVHELTAHEEAARFLEQATFGPNLNGINAMVSTSNDFESWVGEQINVVPKSSHRQFFRKRTNPKLEYAYDVGAVGSFPCEKFSRWRKYALSSRDQIDNRKTSTLKYLQVDLVPGVGYAWKVDGNFRTVTEGPPVTTDGSTFPLGERQKIKWTNGGSWMSDCVGCVIQVGDHNIQNPAVNVQGAEGDASILPYDVVDLPAYGSLDLPSIESPAEYPMFSTWIHENEATLLNTTDLEDSDQCNNFPNFRQPIPHNGVGAPDGVFPTVFGRSIDPVTLEEHVFAYDPHFSFYENTVENPLMDGGGQVVIDTADLVAGTQVKCQNARRNLLNEDHCKMSYLSTACEPNTRPDKVVVIDMPNLAGIRALTGRKLFPLSGLVITDETSPCSSSTSRWVKDETDTSCENVAGIGEMTQDTFGDLIDRRGISGTHNLKVADVRRVLRECDSADTSKSYLGKVQAGDGSCWHHVHRSELTVFDLTDADASQYIVTGDKVSMSTSFLYDTIEANPSIYTEIGKLDDHIQDGGSHPINTDEVQSAFATYEFNAASGAVLMCGSPDEVASDPFEGDNGFDVSKPQGTGTRSSSIWQLSTQRHVTWAHLALHGADELRQKMAWSLSQIVAVGLPGSGMVFNEETEHYIAFYDIFVNYAFGNYRQLMGAFSFNNIMGGWLSFTGNKSLQANIDEEGKANFPDENFAREIMQLFSIGLFKLNMDGSTVMDEEGKPEQTYNIADIVSYSRAWTGFERPSERGGVSTAERQWNDKVIDPMEINSGHRDLYPKTDLMGGYIGDKVALCEELPPKHFLAKGAVYMALGSKPNPQRQNDAEDWRENPDFARLEVLPSSPLYVKLCAADVSGTCTLPTKVVIKENLIYDEIAKMGAEYEVDTIRTVEIKMGLEKPIYYEYIRPPCVELAFYEGGKKQSKGQIWGDMLMEEAICGNPALPTATPMCCSSLTGAGKIYCRYQGERVTYSSAEEICLAEGRMQCHPSGLKEPRAGPCANGIKNAHFRSWSNAYCNVQVKVALDSGDIAIVHDPQADNSGNVQAESVVRQDTQNFFQAQWDGGLHPGSLNDCLAIPSCHIHEDSCICSTEVTGNIVFLSAAEVLSLEEVMDALHLGAVDPNSLDDELYSELGDCGIPGLTVFTTAGGDCSNLSVDTIFSFERKSKVFFVKNSKSTVSITGSGFSFRNPVHFNSLSDPESRDMYHETSEVIDSLFYHPSHPPFLAMRLIQRFGISNPSPRFIERVATAYSTGLYGQIGTGEYGDLGALVAAILLDDESRQVVLDADPVFGQLREPLVKVIAFFRSMGIQYKLPLHMPTLLSTESLIGQGSYESPSVFSFFLPEFAPSVGAIQSAGVVSPESMVLDGGNVINLLEAMYNTVKFGVTDCVSPSFSAYRGRGPFSCASEEGDTSLSPARPTYWPSLTDAVDDILDEISLLLTSGRLGASNREIIKPLVQAAFSTGDVAKAIRVAQELIIGSPEFHATNIARKQGSVRQLTGYETAPAAPYKAIVVVALLGGVDSFNLLVPMGQCQVGDQYAEYVEARGVKALPVANLTAIVDPINQNCREFGVNNDFDILAQLYNENQALFFANTGILSKHTSRHDDWTRDTSFQLFAHNTMVHELYTVDPYEQNAGTGVAGRMLDMLKKNGFHTSANKVGAGGKMLQGDQQYNNPIWSVGRAPRQFDHNPTVDGLFEILKTLNGVGDVSNSVMSETWSSRFAASVFENEQLQEISELPGTDNENYGGSGLSSQLQATAEFMKSRQYRKVNREVFIVKQRGSYDGHDGNRIGELFSEANNAISNFVQTLKDLDLWDSTAIVMGSDFGRSLNPNSNGGSDHAWGGNYFLLGGKVNGGQILGTYPYPLTPEHPKWIGRGRFIPTTPWDAVWNGLSNWMGLRLDEDLDFALPNRKSFSKCDDLFYDSDLFVDGACTCNECAEVTYSPTLSPTTAPPTNQPTNQPIHLGEYVNTIFSTDATVSSVGCDASSGVIMRAIDKNTDKFYCFRDGSEPTGITVQPSWDGRKSVAKKLRVYAHNNCGDCDVVSYIVSGRVDEASEWFVISEGDLPWRTGPYPDRNDQGLEIVSTYESGDDTHAYTEVTFEENAAAFIHYKVQFPDSRDGGQAVQFSEVELPGVVLPSLVTPTPPPSSEPTPLPTANPTNLPTSNPSSLPTSAPVTSTLPPSSEPTPLPTANPTNLPTSNPSSLPTSAPVPVTSTSLQDVFSARGDPPTPLADCQGDCDKDSHCEGDSKCFKRVGLEPVPGCSGEGTSSRDYCYGRPTENTYWYLGNNGSPEEKFPLGLCEGDCDRDSECGPGLVCFQRSGDEPVTGCIGTPSTGQDYCFDPNVAPS